MSENHAPATISFELKFIESIPGEKSKSGRRATIMGRQADGPFTHVFCEELKVRVPFVADDFSAGETAHRNDLK